MLQTAEYESERTTLTVMIIVGRNTFSFVCLMIWDYLSRAMTNVFSDCVEPTSSNPEKQGHSVMKITGGTDSANLLRI